MDQNERHWDSTRTNAVAVEDAVAEELQGEGHRATDRNIRTLGTADTALESSPDMAWHREVWRGELRAAAYPVSEG